VIVLYKSEISDLIFVSAWFRCSVLCKIYFVCCDWDVGVHVCDVEGSKVGGKV
jgi:hypothetical protein